MNIVACTDIHENITVLTSVRKLAEKADIVVCCGDFTIGERNIQAMLSKFEKFPVPVLLIHGNHEAEEDVRLLCKKLKNVIFIHKTIVRFQEVTFVGWGGGGFSRRDREFERWWQSQDIDLPVVLVTHAPAFGTKLDALHKGHVGCTSFTEFIAEVQPTLALSGHIEENNGKSDVLGLTKVSNPGPKGKMYKILV